MELICLFSELIILQRLGKSFSGGGHDQGLEATSAHSANCAELFGV
jgi:hypothetical protein